MAGRTLGMPSHLAAEWEFLSHNWADRLVVTAASLQKERKKNTCWSHLWLLFATLGSFCPRETPRKMWIYVRICWPKSRMEAEFGLDCVGNYGSSREENNLDTLWSSTTGAQKPEASRRRQQRLLCGTLGRHQRSCIMQKSLHNILKQ